MTASGPEPAPSAGRAFATGLLRLAAVGYGLGARLHRRWMQGTAPRRGRPTCAVVSVGALTVGGAGKTPVAARLARGLAERGHRVVLASRGYGGGFRERVRVVSDGQHVHARVEATGDESLVLAAHAPGVPVLVGRDRRIVAHRAVALFDAEIVVLDDGFQHHRLAKDLEIVCIDGRVGFGNRRLLPAGPLREPLSALQAADWLCTVDAGAGFREPEALAAHEARGGRVVHARRRAVGLQALGGEALAPLDTLRGARVGLLAGIARPASLRATLASLGAEVVAERVFPDHHRYRPKDLAGLDADLDAWITTEKDALKILPAWSPGVPIRVLRIEAVFEDEAGVLAAVEAEIGAGA